MVLQEGNIAIKQFDEADQPYTLPDNLNLLSWSVPFLCEKVMEMLDYVVEKYSDFEVKDVELPYEEEQRADVL